MPPSPRPCNGGDTVGGGRTGRGAVTGADDMRGADPSGVDRIGAIGTGPERMPGGIGVADGPGAGAGSTDDGCCALSLAASKSPSAQSARMLAAAMIADHFLASAAMKAAKS